MDIKTAKEIVTREAKRNADYQLNLNAAPTFDPTTGQPLPKPKSKLTEAERKELVIAKLVIYIESTKMTNPKVVGEPYYRADGKMATGANGGWLPWVDDETEERLLKAMIQSMFHFAGLSIPQ